MSQKKKKKKKCRTEKPSPDSRVNLITALINLIITVMNIIAIMKNQN